jgi:uncharacterized membrane protein YoaK (UPF0700 family)
LKKETDNFVENREHIMISFAYFQRVWFQGMLRRRKTKSFYSVLAAVSLAPALFLPFVSIWFLPIILPSMICFLALREQMKKAA